MKRILTALALLGMMAIAAFGATGEGTAVISPSTVLAGSSGNSLDIVFNNGTTPFTAGTIIVVAPAGFTAFDIANAGNPGYFSVSGGTVTGMTSDGKSVTITVGALTNGGTMHFFYSSYTAPTAGAKTFIVKTDTDSTAPVAISTPAVITVLDATATATKTSTPTVTLTATPINTKTTTPTITETSTPTATYTPSKTPTPTGAGPGNIVCTPSYNTGGQTVTMAMNYSNTFPSAFNDGGGIFITWPTGFPTPDLTQCVIMTTNPAASPTVVSDGKTVSITVASLMGRFGTILYKEVIVVPTPDGTGASDKFSFSIKAKTLSTQYPRAINTVSIVVYNATATPVDTATPIPTATKTPDPSAPKSVAGAVVFANGPTYLKSITELSTTGPLAVCNSKTGANAPANIVFTFSPTGLLAGTNNMIFGGKGLFFSEGITVYQGVTYGSAVNVTHTVGCGF